MLKKIYLLLLSLIIVIGSTENGNAQLLEKKKFIEIGVPDIMGIEWTLLSKSKYIITPIKRERNLDFKLLDRPVRLSEEEFVVKGGKYIKAEFDEGEGVFMYIPAEKSKKKIVLSGTNILYAFQIHDSVYIITNTAKNILSKGGLYKVDVQNNNFKLKTIVEFTDAPLSYDAVDGHIYVATRSSFYSIDKGKLDISVENGAWQGLAPNYIAAVSPTEVYMGIRGGFVKFNLEKKDYKVYMYTGR